MCAYKKVEPILKEHPELPDLIRDHALSAHDQAIISAAQWKVDKLVLPAA